MKNKMRDYADIIMNFHLIGSARSQTSRKRTARKSVKRQKTKPSMFHGVFAILFALIILGCFFMLKSDMNKRFEKHQIAFQNTQHQLEVEVAELRIAIAIRDSFCIGLKYECEQLKQQNEILHKSVKEFGMKSTGVIFKNCGAGIVNGGEVNVSMKMIK